MHNFFLFERTYRMDTTQRRNILGTSNRRTHTHAFNTPVETREGQHCRRAKIDRRKTTNNKRY